MQYYGNISLELPGWQAVSNFRSGCNPLGVHLRKMPKIF